MDAFGYIAGGNHVVPKTCTACGTGSATSKGGTQKWSTKMIPQTDQQEASEHMLCVATSSEIFATQLTTPNDDSLIDSHTLTQLWNKVPIDYNGTPQIHHQNCSLLFDNHQPHLINPSLDWPHSPSKTASGSNQPFCHSILSRHTDHHTDHPTDGIDDNSIPWVCMLALLTESNALIIWSLKYYFSM